MSDYIGRFAPSPTGPLHIGSLITAVASYLDARSRGGKWLVRIDDIDPLREQAGADREILACLQAHGLHWDDSVIYQSQHEALYRAALQQLLDKQLAYYCTCSRKTLQEAGGRYPGTCRHRHEQPAGSYAIRLRVDGNLPAFDDRWQGHIDAAAGDDFVIWRKEGYVAYQLAAAVDDAATQISHVVRGSDLLDSTAKQRYLQQLLQLPSPDYGHIPVICNAQGQKLSKQTHAPALKPDEALQNLRRALAFLRQPEINANSTSELLTVAIAQWQPQLIPQQMTVSDSV